MFTKGNRKRIKKSTSSKEAERPLSRENSRIMIQSRVNLWCRARNPSSFCVAGIVTSPFSGHLFLKKKQ